MPMAITRFIATTGDAVDSVQPDRAVGYTGPGASELESLETRRNQRPIPERAVLIFGRGQSDSRLQLHMVRTTCVARKDDD